MLATGIIRRVDDLGRIVIPKEIRRKMNIKESTPMEFFLTDDGLVLRKYSTVDEVGEAIKTLQEWVADEDSDAHTLMTALEKDIFSRLLEITNKAHGETEEEEQ